ncbi:MAG: class I SAM-dependent DNA methyltransferase [Verrucomicrobia bacterium]|nr:class I SAM-dependent DNA methyltransferase [Verrucomicrobiota bacterium]
MTVAEFKKKWARYQGKESAAYQEHFNDLCRLLGQPTPAEADPTGNDFFCFQKRVVKDAELFDLEHPDSGDPAERGFADVWKKACFGWEYKGKKKNLDEAYKQLLRYREALLNPPLLVVCDFDRYIIRTNFNGTVQETFEFTNDEIDRPENLRILRALFENPEFLKPQRTTAQVTTALAEKFAAVARSLQKRESAELTDAKTRAEVNVAQRKNLRIARFLNRLVFCFFAEDTGLLPKNLFSELARTALDDPHQFSQALESLFRTMAKGGMFGAHKIRHFNGHLFDDATVFELNEEERRTLAEASEADWQFVEPSIMGTLFARGLDPDQLAALGAQYTSRPDIVTLVEPVLMAPLRREWAALKASLLTAFKRGRGTPGDRARIQAFLKDLRKLLVMDPACGSGNFLYVSLQMLLDLEKEVITFATMLGFQFRPEVGVHQLRAIEINPYAYELAQVTVQIGYLQWRRDNGFDNDRTPVLQNLDGFLNEDALLVPHFHNKARTLKEAQADQHREDGSLKFYTERQWPECDVLVGNPPFLGGKMLRRELGSSYVEALFGTFETRVRPEADLCCYWFEKARRLIEQGKCKRAGLLATQGIRGGANRDVLKRIKETGDIFFAESDRDWILAGATVHVSMIGFDDGTEKARQLDGREVAEIAPQLSSTANFSLAQPLQTNARISFMGITPAGPFDLPFDEVSPWLTAPNPNRRPNSDVLRPYLNGQDINQRARWQWTIDFGVEKPQESAAKYEIPFQFLDRTAKPIRAKNRREAYARNWWIYAESRPAMRAAFKGKGRFLATCMVAKHRIFAWLDSVCLPANVVIVFGRADDLLFGALNSRFHLVWADRQGTQLREKESGSRYTPTTCFETFPFPFPDDLQPAESAPGKPPERKQPEPDRTYAEMLAAKNYYMGKEEPPPYGSSHMTPDDHRAAIAAAAKELNELRERWLNPQEWTVERVLEFPGSADGPWSRYVVNPDKNGIGTVRYPRLEPRDGDCAAKLKKRTLTDLYNERPVWLDLAHKKLDAAVAAAYGWPAELTDEQILEKLLALNLGRAAEEQKASSVKKPKTSREKRAEEMI